jgi:hypothetical protein
MDMVMEQKILGMGMVIQVILEQLDVMVEQLGLTLHQLVVGQMGFLTSVEHSNPS